MLHVVLLGDSILDNGAYTKGGPDVVAQLRAALPAGSTATLLAVDGSVASDVEAQLAHVPSNTSHLVLSAGGNDALMRSDILQAAVSNASEAFLMLASAVDAFERAYRQTVRAILALRLPLVICSIYNGNFADAAVQRCTSLAIAAFDDVILRVAAEHEVGVIDLRSVCTTPDDYANEIEPSVKGGAKIAAAIVRAIARA